MLEEMAKVAFDERLAEGEKMRLASIARRHAPKRRSIRGTVADALRAVAARLDRDVTVPRHADRGLVRVG
jgi:hypothetical protein